VSALPGSICLSLCLTLCASCHTGNVPPASQPQSAVNGASKSFAINANENTNWQRMKDCAEQTDRMLKRAHLEEGQRIGADTTITGTQNHYSPKYERCYIQVFVSHNLKGNIEAQVKKGVPLVSYDLYDGFEGKFLSSCTDMPQINHSFFCSIEGNSGNPSWDCSACAKFTKDRMTDSPDPGTR